jgi:hypothetical protein
MKRRLSTIAIAALLLATAAACGDDDVQRDAKESTVRIDTENDLKWFTTTDPLTGTSLRCVWQVGYGGGGGMWCVELTEGER